MVIYRKAYAYITHNNRLLVFTQPDFPEAGIQVPGGSIEADETPEQGAIREAHEESGLTGLILGEFLGDRMNEVIVDQEYQHQHGHYFHVICPYNPPETWEHGEFDNSNGDPTPVRFAFYWVDLDSVPPLQGNRGAFLNELRAHLKKRFHPHPLTPSPLHGEGE